jgi:nitrogen regulatory protein P-II 1
MKKVEAIFRPFKLERVIEALVALDVDGMTLSEVAGFGRTGGKTEIFRGSAYSVNLLPKVKLEIVASDRLARLIVEAIEESARSGKIGDGKIFVTEIIEAIRIRTGDWGEAAI